MMIEGIGGAAPINAPFSLRDGGHLMHPSLFLKFLEVELAG